MGITIIATTDSVGLDYDKVCEADASGLDTFVKIIDYLIFVLSTPLSVFGCAANVVSLVVFLKQGRKDCVTVCLFALGFSDFLCCFTDCVTVCLFALGFSDFLCCFTVLAFSSLYIGNVLNNFSIIEPLALDVVMGYAAALFYDISQDVTAFISLQRCLCVALPLRFKDLFTLRRSVGIMPLFYALTAVAYTPHFRTCGLYLRLDASRNLSIPALWQTDDRGESIFWLNYILHIGVDTFYQLVVVVSAAVMITGLEKSSKFHNKTRRNTKQH